eukprot:TRINITY_DN15493_c0_g2_i4.p1 TRINITY_DN15493_c0_g2~~TRINITY_DN15493_c0_g2_i4.p1  ORF type:complete len:638 (+),score=143.48 TRINITY_DN15493_c0_g2_i4:130-2043(+)
MWTQNSCSSVFFLVILVLHKRFIQLSFATPFKLQHCYCLWRTMKPVPLLVFYSVLAALAVLCSEAKFYKNGDQIDISVNTVRPFNNPAETYSFYSLPFCLPMSSKSEAELVDDSPKFGDALAGSRRKPSAYEIFFRTPIVWQRLCQYRLTQDDIKKFMDAIDQDYVFEMFIDGLGVVGFVGDTEQIVEQYADHHHNTTRYYLYTHLAFSIAYHSSHPHDGGYVIAANITTNRAQKVELTLGEKIAVDFSFSCKWVYTPVKFDNRLSLHQKALIGDQALEIHWLSIVNSFVLVILLTTFLAIILMRVLKNDFARYMDADAEELGAEIDDSGWKQVHGDVFRLPENVMLLSAALGNGAQILTLVSGLLLLALVGIFYPGNPGALYTAAVILYALTAGVAGYVSSYWYHQLGGTSWATNAVLTGLLYTGPFVAVFAFLNSVAISYGATSALPFRTIFFIILLMLVVTFPLTLYGSMQAKKRVQPFQSPCKTNFAKREIPAAPWYRTWPFQMFMAGFLPFSAIYIELHYTFSAVWGHRVYTLFGILALAFVMLVAVTSFITIALTYFQLAIEDWRWWWRSFFVRRSSRSFHLWLCDLFLCISFQYDGILAISFLLWLRRYDCICFLPDARNNRILLFSLVR